MEEESEVVLISQPDIPLGSQMIKMTVRKVVKVELRKDDKLCCCRRCFK